MNQTQILLFHGTADKVRIRRTPEESAPAILIHIYSGQQI